MAPNSGRAFVVVLHLLTNYASSLAELLQKWTLMPVIQVSEQIKVEANSVYVIPPGKHLLTADEQLILNDRPHEYGMRRAVDAFFRTLADTHGSLSTAIILSGADGDGAIGVMRIKESGGLTVAQNPGRH
jgi:two-component system, chemotaxis family, CheB/CheR fusion protein